MIQTAPQLYTGSLSNSPCAPNCSNTRPFLKEVWWYDPGTWCAINNILYGVFSVVCTHSSVTHVLKHVTTAQMLQYFDCQGLSTLKVYTFF